MDSYRRYKENSERLKKFEEEVELFTGPNDRVRTKIEFTKNFGLSAATRDLPRPYEPTLKNIFRDLNRGRLPGPPIDFSRMEAYELDDYFRSMFAKAVNAKLPELLKTARTLAKLENNALRANAKKDAKKIMEDAKSPT